jgi:hypothetical protein
MYKNYKDVLKVMDVQKIALILILTTILLFGCTQQMQETTTPKYAQQEEKMQKEEIEKATKLIQVDMQTAIEATRPFECKNQDNAMVVQVWGDEKLRFFTSNRQNRTSETIITPNIQMTSDRSYLSSVRDPTMFEFCTWFMLNYSRFPQNQQIGLGIEQVTKDFEAAGYRCSIADLTEEDFAAPKNEIICDITPELVYWAEEMD